MQNRLTLFDESVTVKPFDKRAIVVMDHETWVTHGSFPNQKNLVLTRESIPNSTDTTFLQSVCDVWRQLIVTDSNVFIINSDQLRRMFMPFCKFAFVTRDLNFPESYSLLSSHENTKIWINRDVKEYHPDEETHYLDLLLNVLTNGIQRNETLSLFAPGSLRFNLSGDIVPLITTKRVSCLIVIKELLWFLRGDTDAKILQSQGVNIWNKNTSRESLDRRGLEYPVGVLGPGYGWSWRRFGDTYDVDLADSSKWTTTDDQAPTVRGDQIANIEKLLKTDPFSRRILLNSWNPTQIDQMALPPCHVLAQFYVGNARDLSCHVYMRSNDLFLGCPYNIFSYAVLTRILALRCDLVAKELVLSFGDAHIYNDHVEQVKTQLLRDSFPFPRLMISESVRDKDYHSMSATDFSVIDYTHHKTISANLIVHNG
jgi:thymidylate synthase